MIDTTLRWLGGVWVGGCAVVFAIGLEEWLRARAARRRRYAASLARMRAELARIQHPSEPPQ